MSNVPKAREAIAEITEQMAELALQQAALADRLEAVMADLHRRPEVRKRAPRTSAPVGPKMAAHLRKYAHANPRLSQAEIAQRFGINPGRVAEALHGDR
jgi:hypothetical protein